MSQLFDSCARVFTCACVLQREYSSRLHPISGFLYKLSIWLITYYSPLVVMNWSYTLKSTAFKKCWCLDPTPRNAGYVLSMGILKSPQEILTCSFSRLNKMWSVDQQHQHLLNLLEMQIIRPLPRPDESECLGRGSWICILKIHPDDSVDHWRWYKQMFENYHFTLVMLNLMH